MKIDLSICIVNWNTKTLLRKCLQSIYDKTKVTVFEIIVVDNASEDGSIEMLQNEFAQCKIIPCHVNLGFSRANNLASQQAGGKYYLFLNPDTTLKSSAIDGMFEFLEQNPEYGAIGCKLLNEDNSIQYTCARKFPTPFDQFSTLALLDRIFRKSKFFGTHEMRFWDHCESRSVDCLSGACIMARGHVIDYLGGFNEHYFMYGEDIELCHKIKNNGWLIYYLAEEEIYHFSGASSNQIKDKSFSAVMQRESNYKFMYYNYGKLKALEFRTAVFIGSLIRLLFLILLLPYRLVSQDIRKQIPIYSLKKYFKLFLWATKLLNSKNVA